MKPTISVIVPVYNVEKYLNRCLESILKQSFEDFELILVDDGSTDQSSELCNLWERRDARVRVIHQENRGQSAARNVGIQMAEGEYLSFVDSDDVLDSTYLAYLYQMIVNYDADMAGAKMQRVEEGRRDKIEQGEKPDEQYTLLDSEEALKKMCRADIIGVSPCAKLYKKSLFDNVRYPVGKIHEDLSTTYLIIASCKRVVIGTKTIYYYMQHKGSSMHQPLDEHHMYTIFASERLLEFVKANYPNIENAAHVRAAIAILELIPMLIITSEGKYKYYKKIKQAMKTHIRAVLCDDFVTNAFKIKCVVIMMGYIPTFLGWKLLMHKKTLE